MTADDQSTPARLYGGRSVADRRAERRDRFRAAGLELFGTIGFARVTISALCAEAGLSRRQFYEEYSSSEELLTEIYRDIQESALEAVSAAVEAADSTDLTAVARAAMNAYMDVVASDPRHVRCSFIEVGGISETMEATRVASRDECASYMATVVTALPGATRRPIDYEATAFIGSMTAVVHRWATAPVQPERAVVVNLLADLLVRLADAPE